MGNDNLEQNRGFKTLKKILRVGDTQTKADFSLACLLVFTWKKHTHTLRTTFCNQIRFRPSSFLGTLTTSLFIAQERKKLHWRQEN